jgi:hypothetical protein
MSELTVQTLRELAPEDLAKLLPAAVQIDSRAGVILRQIGDTEVELYHGAHIICAYVATLDFEPVTEPAAQAAAFAEAVEALTICRRVGFEASAELRQTHAEQLAAIRQYAITRHEGGEICRGGLESFLATFDMEPYAPRVRVDYAISGSYEVQHRDTSFVETDACGYLRPDLTELDDVDHDSSTYEVTTVDVTEL